MAGILPQTAESEPRPCEPQAPLIGKLVAFLDDKEAPKFHWSDVGRHGYSIVRKCAFLLHLAKASSDQAHQFTYGKEPKPACQCSGASRCFSLLQGLIGVSTGEGGCLLETAAAFLEAAWTELRQVALRELRDYARVMEPLHRVNGLTDETVMAAMIHVRRRCPVWTALHRAPADLLRDLSEALAEAMAPAALRALRGATAVLLESWQAGLAQLGGLLLSRVVGGRVSEQADLRPGAVLDQGRSASWLMCWRLYLGIYRRITALGCKPQQSEQRQQLQRHQAATITAGPYSSFPRCSGSEQDPRWRISAFGLDAAPVSAVNGTGGSGGVGSVSSGSRPETAMPRTVHDIPTPPQLLTSFMSANARDAAAAVFSAEQVSSAGCGPREGPSAHCGRPAAAEVMGAQQRLGAACLHATMQLEDALAEDLSEDEVERRLLLVLVRSAASGADAGPVVPEAASLQEGVAPLASNTGPAEPSGDVTSQPGTTYMAALQRPAAACCSSSSSSLENSAALGTLGDVPASGCGACTNSLPGDLVAELPPKRLCRLCNSPGLLSLHKQLKLLSMSCSGEVAPGQSHAHDRGAASRDGLSMRHMCRAAMIHGMCTFLHLTRSILASAYLTSRMPSPRAASQWLPGRSGRGQLVAHAVPTLAVQQLPTGAVSCCTEAAAVAAGAAALAAAGARAARAANASAESLAPTAMLRAAARLAMSGDGVGVNVGVSGCGGPPLMQTALGSADSQAKVEDTDAVLWAYDVERRAAALLSKAPGGMSPPKEDAVVSLAPVELSSEEISGAAGLHGGSLAVVHDALLLSAGRVSLLGTSLVLPSSSRMSPYRWGGAEPTTSGAMATDAAPAAAPPSRFRPSVAAGLANRTAPNDEAWLRGRSSEYDCHMDAPTARALLLHAAIAAGAAAANRLVHVASMHAPGSGSSDLRPLCVAHSDAVALGSATRALLGLIGALGSQLAGPDFTQHPDSGVVDERWAACQSAAAKSVVAAKARGNEQIAAATAWAPRGSPGLVQLGEKSSAPVTGEAGPRLSQKLNWRRSLRRIMPYRTERSSSHVGRDRERGTAAAERRPGPPGPGQQAAAAPRPLASRACWASEPIEPLPLPPPAPLCSIAIPHLQGVEAGQGRLQPGTGAVAAPPQLRPFDAVFRSGTAASVASTCSGPAGFVEGGGRALAADDWHLSGAGAWHGAALLVLSPAEACLLRTLNATCQQLQAAAGRAGDLLEAEMAQRAAMICRNSSGNSSKASERGLSAASSMSASGQVAASLLKPLREALAGLHPISQCQLLSRSFTAVLLVLRQHLPVASVGVGGDGTSRVAATRRGGVGGAVLTRQFGEGLAVVEEEFAASWRQIDAATSSRTGMRMAVESFSSYYAAGEYDDACKHRAMLEGQIRSLRNEIGDLAAV